MSNGIIRHNTNPFSSPIFLSRKRIDHGAFVWITTLNAITIKNSFPIPTVDELLDELGGATWFTKLDLLQGHYQ